MYLMYYTNEKGERVYTLKVRGALREGKASRRHLTAPAAAWCRFCGHIACASPRLLATALSPAAAPAAPAVLQKVAPDGTPTQSAHPARFSPDDKFSRERTTCKKRFGLLLTQQPAHVY